VEDVKYSGPDRRAEQEVYVPVAFWPMAYVSVLLRTSGDPTRLVDPARQAVRAVDADLPIEDIRTMDTVVSASVASQRFRFLLIGLFAGLALALSAVGLYGVMSQSVAQRAREMGIRMALGASRSRIVGLVLTEAMALVAMGVGAGIAASAMATRVLTSFLFGVTLFDVRVYALVACVVAMVCALAAFSPARRAVQSDPIVVLRAE
jgi:putative ABC transport system permease protein